MIEKSVLITDYLPYKYNRFVWDRLHYRYEKKPNKVGKRKSNLEIKDDDDW